MENEAIRTADHVKHKPTGESWVVACVQGNDLSWCGWPEGMARVSDCELIRKGTEEERLDLLKRLSEMPGPDHRKSYAQTALAAYRAQVTKEGV